MAGVTISIATTFLAAMIYGYGMSVPQAELLPEVAYIVQGEEIEKSPDELNDYAAAFAINAPVGIDFVAVGVDEFRRIRQRALNVLHGQDDAVGEVLPQDFFVNDDGGQELPLPLDVGGDSNNEQRLYFGCTELANHSCAADIIAHWQAWEGLIERNVVLDARYGYVMQQPYWHAGVYALNDPVPRYDYFLQISQLRLAQAVLLANKGKGDEAIELMGREVDFYRKMRLGAGSLINHMAALRGLYTIYHTLEQLLEIENMQPYLADERLAALMQPLPLEEQGAMAATLRAERNGLLYMFYTLQSDIEAGLSSPVPVRLMYDPHETSNRLYQYYEPVIHHASLTMHEASERYLGQRAIAKASEVGRHVLECAFLSGLQEEWLLRNWMGRVLLCSVTQVDMMHNYVYRDYDFQVYMALVRLKYEIVRREIPASDISDFLIQVNDLAINPYTQELFEWNLQQRILSTTWVMNHFPVARGAFRMNLRVY